MDMDRIWTIVEFKPKSHLTPNTTRVKKRKGNLDLWLTPKSQGQLPLPTLKE